MRCLLACLTLCLLGFGLQAEAQAPTAPDVQQRAAVWARVLKRAEVQLREPNLTLPAVKQIRGSALAILVAVNGALPPLKQRVAEIESLLAALGPAPKQDQTTESEDIAAQRARLNEELKQPKGDLKRLEIIIQRANATLEHVTRRRREVMTRLLLLTGPSVWDGLTWSKAWVDAGSAFDRMARSPAEWWTHATVERQKSSGGLFVLAGIVIVTVAGALFLRRYMLRRFGRTDVAERPSYGRRFSAAWAEGLALGLIPIAICVFLYLALLDRGLILGVFGDLVRGAVVALIAFLPVVGISRAALAPAHPRWRTTAFSDDSARAIALRLKVVAAIFCLNLFLRTASQSLYLSDELIAVSGFIVNSALALSMLWLLGGRPWRPAAPAGGTTAEPSAPPGERPGILWPLARFLAIVVAIAVPISAVLGYQQLAQYFAGNLVLSAALFGIARSVHGAVRDVVGLLKDEQYGSGARIRRALRLDESTARLISFWSVLLLDITLLAASIFLLLLIWGADWAYLVVLVERVWSGISVGQYTIAVGDILIAIAAFVLLVVLVRAGQRLFDERLKSQTRIDVGVRHALRTGFGYTGITISAMLAISVAGFDLSNLALIAGALSVGIGFGLQGVVNNFVSGIILLVERPIKEGDWVVVDGHEGHVRNISVRSTEINTFQRASVIIPNATLITSPVINWSYKDPSGRIDVAVGVAYGSDVEKVKNVLLACAEQHDKVRRYPAPDVMFRDFGDSALAFELRCFTGDIGQRLLISSDLRFAIARDFRANGIEIPFPQRDIHVRGATLPKGRAKSHDPALSKPKTRSARRRRAESGEAGNGGGDA